MNPMLLAGDIGGTKTNLMVFDPGSGYRRPAYQAHFASADYENLEALVGDFLQRTKAKVNHASFAVAGPVVECQAKVTNLPWDIQRPRLMETLGLDDVGLLNDLEAIALSVPSLEAQDLFTLIEGERVAGGMVAVIAPGTGLGEAFLHWESDAYRAYPSEGGHADFAPVDPRQMDLLDFMFTQYDHVSYERVCSGKGLPNLYRFLRDRGYEKESPWLAEQLAQADDPTPLIVNAAQNEKQPCSLCKATLKLFVSILGAEAGNLALKLMAMGGVYVGGGIPPRILSALQGEEFSQAFEKKGRFSGFISKLPVHVILNPKAALYGAACHVSHWSNRQKGTLH